MDGKKNDRRKLDTKELDKVAGGEERRREFNAGGQQGNQGGQEIVDRGSTPVDPLTPEQIQALLNAAMENMNPTKGPVKR